MFVQQMIAMSRGAARRRVDATRRADDSSDQASVSSPQQADPPAKILASPLFDAAWYAEAAGCSTVPIEAARHYLRHGARRGLWPHPLFVPHHVAARAPEAVGDTDPLLAYLEKRLFKLSPHPLFDLKGYVAAHPESRRHPSGPLGHYVEHGAAQGLAPNPWYTPTPEEPRGLTDWSAARWQEWAARKQLVPRLRTGRLPASHPAVLPVGPDDTDPDGPTPHVSVVVESVRGVDTLARTLRSVVDQVDVRVEIVVVTDGLVPDLDTRLAPLPDHVSLVVVRHEGSRASTGLNLALEQVTGDLVAFVAAGEAWETGRLRRLAAACRRDGRGVAYDSMLVQRPEKPPVYAAATLPSGTPPVTVATVELTRLVLAREVLDALGGFDETLRGGWEADFTFRLLSRHEATHVTVVGVERDIEVVAEARRLDPPEQPVPDHSAVPTWSDVAFNRYAIDWERLERRPAGPDVISVVIPTHDDWRMTRGSVLTVLGSEVPAGMSLECIVLDNGSDAATAQMLDSLGARYDGVRVVHAPTNFGYAVGNNLAVGEVRGDTVVFLNNDTKVDPGWLRPLASQLADPDVQAVQSLLLYPSGTIQSAGVVFPDCGGVPYAFLAGFPVEDAAGLERESFSALTGASLAMRFQDVVALRGFDPLFRNGMEDVDLCLRLARLRPGRCVVEPASRVTHLESRTAGRFDKVVMNRRLFLDRWDATAPRDDSAIWVGRGFDVVDHVVRTVVSDDRRLCTPEPVLVRSRALVTQHPPRLRWALKNPATQGPWGDAWGDTHFARCLATALRELGQDVVTDRGSEFYRGTGYLDDVVLTLRGRTEFQPSYGQVNLAWVISHPEMLSWQEATSYDRVLAASESWSKKMSERWGMHIDPLMQATDPVLFHPDRAPADTGPEVLFVGNSRGKRRPMVEDAMAAGLPLSVYGTCWEEFLPPGVLRGEFVPNTELGAMYASAGVVLNDHWDDMRTDGFLSNRLFDAAASGARVITDDVTGLNHLFGSSVQVARDAGELAALVSAPDRDEIFGSLDERRRVAALVHREHSFLTRARVLLDAALAVRAEQDRRR